MSRSLSVRAASHTDRALDSSRFRQPGPVQRCQLLQAQCVSSCRRLAGTDSDRALAGFEAPILASRQPNATAKAKKAGEEAFELLTSMQRNFVLRRTNEVILKHLPPKRASSRLLVSLARADLTRCPQSSIPSSSARQSYRSIFTRKSCRARLSGRCSKGTRLRPVWRYCRRSGSWPTRQACSSSTSRCESTRRRSV